MSGARTIVGAVAAQACRDNPDLPSRTIARMLHKEHPELFSSVESARSFVRMYRGNHGKRMRREIADKSAYRPNGKAGTVRIPEGLKEGKPPVVIKGPCKQLILNDVHVPYHDARAIRVAVQYGLDQGCDSLYINGDWDDMYAISRFQKDPRKRDLYGEIQTSIDILAELSEHWPRAGSKHFKSGNHEDRFDHYLFTHAEQLVGFDAFELKSLLQLDDLGYEFVQSKQWTQMGKLNVLHGHELNRGIATPVNAARGMWLKLSETSCCGHWHASSQHSHTQPITKRQYSTWAIGCLCNLQPEYSPLNSWNLGFGIAEIFKDDTFHFSNFKIDPETYLVYPA